MTPALRVIHGQARHLSAVPSFSPLRALTDAEHRTAVDVALHPGVIDLDRERSLRRPTYFNPDGRAA